MNKDEALKLALGKVKSARYCDFEAIDTLVFEAEELLEQALAAPVQEPVAIDELTDIFHRAWQKDFKESELGGMSTGSEELKGQWREHVKAGIRALLAAQRQRVVFPTMLRKMWSGGEVQAWLDENVNKDQHHE